MVLSYYDVCCLKEQSSYCGGLLKIGKQDMLGFCKMHNKNIKIFHPIIKTITRQKIYSHKILIIGVLF